MKAIIIKQKHMGPVYFLLIPFFYPRGFSVYFPIYTLFFTIWLYLSEAAILLLLIWLIGSNRSKVNYGTIVMALYYIVFLAITLIVQGGISEGLQKLFSAPSLCLLCALLLEIWPEKVIKCVSNILIFVFLLNLIPFNPLLWSEYFQVGQNLLFLGHVQVAAQMGVLAIFLSYLEYIAGKRRKAAVLVVLSLLTMLMSHTAASYVSILFFFLAYWISRCKNKSMLYKFLRSDVIIIIFLICNVIIFAVVSNFNGATELFIRGLTNGRTFIWSQALALMKNHWLIGYGAYGVLIKVFFSPTGMNYAHNEILQRLLDGGIVLSVLFIIMISSHAKNIRKVRNENLYYWGHFAFALMLVLMLFESVTEYYYFFMLLTILSYLPRIEEHQRKTSGGDL